MYKISILVAKTPTSIYRSLAFQILYKYLKKKMVQTKTFSFITPIAQDEQANNSSLKDIELEANTYISELELYIESAKKAVTADFNEESMKIFLTNQEITDKRRRLLAKLGDSLPDNYKNALRDINHDFGGTHNAAYSYEDDELCKVAATIENNIYDHNALTIKRAKQKIGLEEPSNQKINLQHMIEAINKKLTYKQTTITIELDDTAKIIPIYGNKAEMYVGMYNTIKNAHTNGEAKKVTISLAPFGNNYYKLEIKNNGLPFPTTKEIWKRGFSTSGSTGFGMDIIKGASLANSGLPATNTKQAVQIYISKKNEPPKPIELHKTG